MEIAADRGNHYQIGETNDITFDLLDQVRRFYLDFYSRAILTVYHHYFPRSYSALCNPPTST